MLEPFITYDAEKDVWEVRMQLEVPRLPPVCSSDGLQKRCQDVCEYPVKAGTLSWGSADLPRDIDVTLSADFSSKEEAESIETRGLFRRSATNVIEMLS